VSTRRSRRGKLTKFLLTLIADSPSVAGAENGGNVPAIAMTAFGGFAVRERTIAAGFQAHLDKPFVPESLVEAIKSILRS